MVDSLSTIGKIYSRVGISSDHMMSSDTLKFDFSIYKKEILESYIKRTETKNMRQSLICTLNFEESSDSDDSDSVSDTSSSSDDAEEQPEKAI